MPSIVPNRYSLDYSGTSASNLIENESVTLQTGPFRAFSPLYSPYFKKNISIVDSASGLILSEEQYVCQSLVASASAIAGIGNDVYSIVVILDEAVSSSLVVTYQTVGGPYTTGYESLLNMINNLIGGTQVGNTDPLAWESVNKLPAGFPENLHLHTLGNTTGWEFLVAALEKLRNAILLGDQLNKNFVLSYIDDAIIQSAAVRAQATEPGTPFGDHISDDGNPHNTTKESLGLGLVENYATATLQEAFDGSASNLYVTADQVRAVVLDSINLGMDAHILDTNNPHVVTKAQVGLSNVLNYGVAVSNDLDFPADGTLKYVTNTVAAQWLHDYFLDLNSGNASSITTLNDNSLAAIVLAQSALDAANASQTTVDTGGASIIAAIAVAEQALDTATQNAVNAQNSTNAAQQLILTYLSPAITAAESAAYSRGFADGVASQ